MSKRINPQTDKIVDYVKPPTYEIICSWCGGFIRSTTIETAEQMCLICHARMLNDYFQKMRKTAKRG